MPEQFRLTIESSPGWSVPAVVRVRRALKVLLRAFGLKCVDLAEVDRVEQQREQPGKRGIRAGE
ncbi:MAG TPA: hypothetical protein VFG04_08890 [Planctomycetaceae bacterium]|nr:hypothetical protein [Planctomycetaceae bacterium]